MGAPANRATLFQALGRLSAAQCESIATELGMPRDKWVPASASANDRSAAILQWAERRGPGLEALGRAIEDVAGGSAKAAAPGAWERLRRLPGQVVKGARDRGFEKRYVSSVIESLHFASGPGVVRADGVKIPFEAVYVDRRLLPLPATWDAEAGSPILSPARPVGDHLRALPDATALCISGVPGSGKSTVLRHLALSAARGAAPRIDEASATLPLLLHLDEHAGDIATGTPLGRIAQRHFENAARFPGMKPPAGFFDAQLDAGRCFVLLDGLDDFDGDEARGCALNWIEQQIAHYPTSRFVVTAPQMEDGRPPLGRARVVETLALDDDELQRAATAWYDATAGRTTALGRRALPADAEHALADFLQRVGESVNLRPLAKSPLHLSLLLLVHRHSGALPEQSFLLHREAMDALLEWQEVGGGALWLEHKRRVLEALAEELLERRAVDLPFDYAQAIVADTLEAARAPAVSREGLLRQFAQAGLLVERAPGRWSFHHRMLAEFSCASRWVEAKTAGSALAARADEPWWHGALGLYAQAGDANALVAAALNGGTPAALALATGCAETSRTLVLPLRREVAERGDAALESTDPARRRVAAAARLRRRLLRFDRVDPEREIDGDHLTAAEYQLFLDDLGARAIRHAPDHWLADRVPEGAGAVPQIGVRRSDADAFCVWLTARSAGTHYRLPSLAELEAAPVDRDDLVPLCAVGASLVLSADAAEESLATLARYASGLPPPRADLLRRALADEIAAGRDETIRQLEWIAGLAMRGLAEPREASAAAGNTPPAIRDLRSLAPPETGRRESVLDYLRAVHRALGIAVDEVPLGHYTALRKNPHLDYSLVLDAVLALVIAHDLPRFISCAAGRQPFDPDVEVTSSALRGLSHAGARARMLLERRYPTEAVAELRAQLSRGTPSQDPAQSRLAALLASRMELAAAPTPADARLAFWHYGAHAAAIAFDFAERRTDRNAGFFGRLLPGDARAARYRDWANGPLLDLFWWTQLVLARAAGHLPAFEAIRLLRDSVPLT